MQMIVNFTVAGIDSPRSDHFKVLFRDVPDEPFYENYSRESFFDILFDFVAIVMEGNELTVVFINSGCGYNRATEIAADIFDYGFRITFIRLGINIEALFVF